MEGWSMSNFFFFDAIGKPSPILSSSGRRTAPTRQAGSTGVQYGAPLAVLGRGNPPYMELCAGHSTSTMSDLPDNALSSPLGREPWKLGARRGS